jgi:hypothetical protein
MRRPAPAILRYAAGAVPLEDAGDLRRDLVDFLVRLAAALTSPNGRALQQVLQASGRTR